MLDVFEGKEPWHLLSEDLPQLAAVPDRREKKESRKAGRNIEQGVTNERNCQQSVSLHEQSLRNDQQGQSAVSVLFVIGVILTVALQVVNRYFIVKISDYSATFTDELDRFL
jgi:hypothetical protein